MKMGEDLRGRKNILKVAFEQEIAKLKAERFNAQTERQNKVVKAGPAGLQSIQEIDASSTKENSQNGAIRALRSQNKDNGSRVSNKKIQNKKEPKNVQLPIKTQPKKFASKRDKDTFQKLQDQVRELLQQQKDLETQVSEDHCERIG